MYAKNKADYSPRFLVVIRSIVVASDGRILLLKRSGEHNYYPYFWELPGGRVLNDAGSHFGLTQIVHRETGLVVDPRARRFFAQNRFVSEKGKYQGCLYVEIAVESELVGGEVCIDPHEHTEYIWVYPDKAFYYNLTLESKKSLAEWFAETKREKEEGLYSVILVGRALITNDAGQYLLIKRSNKVIYPNCWELPGGKFKSLELFSDLLKREVFEETALVIQLTNEIIHFSSFIEREVSPIGSTYVNIISEAKIIAGKLRLSDEHVDFGWFTSEQMFSLDLVSYLRLPLTELFLKKEGKVSSKIVKRRKIKKV